MELIKGAQPGPSIPLGTVRPGCLGLLGLQDRKHYDREDRLGGGRPARSCGCVGHVRVSSGACRAARSLGYSSSSAGFRVGCSWSCCCEAYSPEYVEGKFFELRVDGVLRTSP